MGWPLSGNNRNAYEGSTSSSSGACFRFQKRRRRDLRGSLVFGSLDSGSGNGGRSNIFLQAYVPNNLVEATTNAFDITTKSTFESSKKVGYIKELPSNELFLHNLMIVDEEYFSDESEDYKLKMSLDVIDSFKIELENTKQEMLMLISDLSLTYNGLFGKLDKQRIINFFSGNGILIGDSLNFIRIESQSLFNNSIFYRCFCS